MRAAHPATFAAALLLPLMAVAQTPAVQQQLPRHFLADQAPDQVLASAVMGIDVAGPEGESIGNVEDLLVDRDGRLAALIVEVGGFLGIGEKEVAIPVEALTFDLEAEPVLLEPPAGATEPHEDRSAVWN